MKMKGGDNMNDEIKKILKDVRRARKYDTVANMKISKETEGKIINVMDWLEIEYEEAAELLIELGYRNMN